MVTKEEIKNSAHYCFAHYGYEGTTMQDIAKAVGLKKQSLYTHYESKDAIYQTVLREQNARILAELRTSFEQLQNLPAEDLLKGLFVSIVNIFQNRESLLLWLRAIIYHGSNSGIWVSDTLEWHYEKPLSNMLYDVLKDRYAILSDYNTFNNFFFSYMLIIQGYLSWMVSMGEDAASWEAVWLNFWNGVNGLFVI